MRLMDLLSCVTELTKSFVGLASSRIASFPLIVTLVAATLTKLCGQDPNVANQLTYIDFLPPSPSSASLADFTRAGGGLSSGAAVFNVPITTIGLAEIKVPISLSYSSAGVKVDEISSRIGIGWQLQAGGSITRAMQGAVDENSEMLEIPSNYTGSVFYNYLKQATLVAPGSTFDTQPDIFTFNVCGLTGKFYLDDNDQPVLVPKSNLKITADFSGTADFIITDQQGNKFYLGGVGYTERGKRQGSGTKPFYELYSTAWFLRKIESYDGEEITFYYKSATCIYDVGLNQTLYHTYDPPPPPDETCERSCPEYPPAVTINYVQSQTQYLDSIHSPNNSLKFTYKSRNDLPGDVLLESITVFDNYTNSVKETFDFTVDQIYTEEFSNTWADGVPGTSYRPFLKKISRTAGADTVMINSFEYDNPEALPVRLSYAQDHWGYFNGMDNQNFVPTPDPLSPAYLLPRQHYPAATANREANEDVAVKGTLKKIVYPTGGYDLIEYELNRFDTEWTIEPPGDTVLTFSRINSDGNNYADQFEITLYVPQTVVLQIDVEDQQISQAGPIKAGKISLHQGETLVALAKVILEDLHDPNAGDDNTPVVSVDLLPGTYQGMFSCIGKVNAEGSVAYKPHPPIIMPTDKPIGGLRVKSIKGYSLEDEMIDEKHYEYTSVADSGRSSLAYYRKPGYFKLQHSVGQCYYTGEFSQCPPYTCTTGIMYSSSIVNFSPFAGNHIFYSSVIEYSGPSKSNGFIEHEYYAMPDQEGDVVYGEPIIGAPSSNNSVILQEKEKLTTLYVNTESGPKPVKVTHYWYSPSDLDILFGYVVNQRMIECYPFEENPSFDAFEATRYALFSPWTVLDSMRVVEYAGLNDSLVTAAVFEYNNDFVKMPTKVTTLRSDKKVAIVTNMFVNDTTSIPGLTSGQRQLLSTMAEQNVLNPLVYQEVEVDGTPISAYRAFFLSQASNVYPSKIIQYNGNGVEIGSFEMMDYDDYGNVIQRRKDDDVLHSYIWDYSHQLLTCEVVGATAGEIAATSFEAEGTGNWSVTGSYSAIHDETSPTGFQYAKFATTGSIQKSGLSPGTHYTISFFHKAGVVAVPGSFDAVTVNARDGWSYTQMSLSGTSTATINVPSNGEIDEVRLYPKNATMTTYTWNPGIGISSTSDTNNISTLYRYDSFGRLKSVKDNEGNLLKVYDYHYKKNINAAQ